MKDRTTRNSHPGWAVQYEDGSWLAYGHGWHQFTDAFYARLYPSEQAARNSAEEAAEDFPGDKYNIVPGWEPVAEQLRHDVAELKHANTFDPDDIFDITMELESIVSRLKDRDDH
jgi:hypothetical protein